MPANYVLLAEQTVSTAVASVTFSNIPQTGYTDLKIVASTRGAASGVAEANRIRFNGDTTNTNYIGKRLLGSGSAPSSDQTPTIAPGFFNNTSGATANTFSNSEVYIPNYTGSTTKSYSVDTVTENNATEAYAAIVASRWSGTAAITSITFVPESANNYAQFSTFTLYGLAALGTTPVIAPKATGGDIVTNDGTYWYHAFLSSGIFTPNQALSCDYLVVAGGGGGAPPSGTASGGGGAGGYRTSIGGSPLSLTATNYAVTVGAGGAGSTSLSVLANGNNSVFSTITSTGGGGGGIATGTPVNGGNGGSGGGGSAYYTSNKGLGNTPSTSPSQGNDGGNGLNLNINASGGGGGAGGNGGGGSGSNAGAGGAGSNSASSFASATATGVSGFYAGGGGGGSEVSGAGTGGSGGGGAGSNEGKGTDGTVNTGGGGGGSGNPMTGVASSGGSGIVIVRYTMA